MKNSRKFFAIVMLSIAIAALSQLNLENSVSAQGLTLDQLVQQAEACFEVGGGGYECCVAESECYIGGGFFMSPFDYNF